MTSIIRLRSESLPILIPEITLTTTISTFRRGKKGTKNQNGPPHSHQTLSKSEEHLPSIRQSDSIVKSHVREGKKERRRFFNLSPLYRTLSRSEEFLPSISDSGTVLRRNSSPKDVLLLHRGIRSNGFQNTRFGKKRRMNRSHDRLSSESTKPTVSSENQSSSPINEPFLLPPLPTASQTYQTAMRDFHYSDSSSASEDSGSEGSGEHRFHGDRKRWTPRPKLAWYGPLVEYKGHHIYLSTLNTLKANAGRYAKRPWC